MIQRTDDCPYQRIEYLENSTADPSCIIDSGYIPTGEDNEYIIEFMYLNSLSDSQTCLINTNAPAGITYARFLIWENNGSVSCDNGNNTSDGAAYAPLINNKKSVLRAVRQDAFYVDNIEYKWQKHHDVRPLNNSLKLFALNSKSKAAHARIYNFKFIDGTGETVFDLIPVRIDDKGYFYNKANGQLLGSAVEGSLTLGPDIS